LPEVLDGTAGVILEIPFIIIGLLECDHPASGPTSSLLIICTLRLQFAETTLKQLLFRERRYDRHSTFIWMCVIWFACWSCDICTEFEHAMFYWLATPQHRNCICSYLRIPWPGIFICINSGIRSDSYSKGDIHLILIPVNYTAKVQVPHIFIHGLAVRFILLTT
jgi:hypothetical protein